MTGRFSFAAAREWLERQTRAITSCANCEHHRLDAETRLGEVAFLRAELVTAYEVIASQSARLEALTEQRRYDARPTTPAPEGRVIQ